MPIFDKTWTHNEQDRDGWREDSGSYIPLDRSREVGV